MQVSVKATDAIVQPEVKIPSCADQPDLANGVDNEDACSTSSSLRTLTNATNAKDQAQDETQFSSSDSSDEEDAANGHDRSRNVTAKGRKDRWLMHSFASANSRPASFQSCTSWDEEMSDYDRQVSKMVKALFNQIDCVLFEYDDVPGGSPRLSKECADWRRLFPHLRVLGSQLCTSVDDVGYGFTSSSTQLIDATPRIDESFLLPNSETSPAHANVLPDYDTLNQTEYDSDSGDCQQPPPSEDRSTTIDQSVIIGVSMRVFAPDADAELSESGDFAEETILAEGRFEETLAIDRPQSGVAAGNDRRLLATAPTRERALELLRLAESTSLKDRVFLQLFDAAWLLLAELLRPLLHAFAERKTRGSSTASRRRRVLSNKPFSADADRSSSKSDTISRYGSGQSAEIDRRERLRRGKSRNGPWSGVFGQHLPISRSDSAHTETHDAVMARQLADFKQETALAAEFINIIKPIKVAGRLQLARKILNGEPSSEKVNLAMAIDLPLMCPPMPQPPPPQPLAVDGERPKAFLNSSRVEKARKAKLEPLTRAGSQLESIDGSTPTPPPPPLLPPQPPRRAAARTNKPSANSPSLPLVQTAGPSPARERSAGKAVGAKKVDDGLMSVQSISRMTDTSDSLPQMQMPQRNGSSISVASLHRSQGNQSSMSHGTATPSTTASGKAKTPWVPWKGSPGAANAQSSSPAPAPAHPLRLLPASGEVLRLNATSNAATPSANGGNAQRPRNTLHPYNTKVFALSQEASVFHEFYRRNFGIRGNGVSLNNRVGK